MSSIMSSGENSTFERQKIEMKESFIINSNVATTSINDLPDQILSHILSFLPTIEATKTSILCKSFRFVWTKVSNLDIYDLYSFCNITMYCAKRFTDWMDNVLISFEPIDKFSLNLQYYADINRINMWIFAAVLRKVRDLKLCLNCDKNERIDVAAIIFHYERLEALTIISKSVFRFPEQESVCFSNLMFLSLENVDIDGIPAAEKCFVCFPKLATLHLKYVTYVGNGDSVMKFVSNCPVLEDLLIERFVDNHVLNTDMSIPALRTAYLYFISDKVNTSVEIDSPVEKLTLKNWSPSSKVLVKKLDSLIDAHICISGYKSGDYQQEQRDEFFKLDKVYRLTLSTHTVNVIRDNNIMLPTFCNLIQLEVDLECKDLCMLQCLLDKSINLRTLIINKTEYSPCLDEICETMQWTELSPVTKCLVASLKYIEIRGCIGCTNEVAMIKSMLKCANILKRFSTESPAYDRVNVLKMHSLTQEIPVFPRASPVVDFKFSIFYSDLHSPLDVLGSYVIPVSWNLLFTVYCGIVY